MSSSSRSRASLGILKHLKRRWPKNDDVRQSGQNTLFLFVGGELLLRNWYVQTLVGHILSYGSVQVWMMLDRILRDIQPVKTLSFKANISWTASFPIEVRPWQSELVLSRRLECLRTVSQAGLAILEIFLFENQHLPFWGSTLTSRNEVILNEVNWY